MREIKTVTYNNKAFYIKQMHPMKSMLVFKRLLVLAGPTIGDFIEKTMGEGKSVLDQDIKEIAKEIDIKKAFTGLLEKLDENELEDTAGKLLSCVTIGKGNDEGLTTESKEIIEIGFVNFMSLLKDVFAHNYLGFSKGDAE